MDTPQQTPTPVLTRARLAGGLACLALVAGARAEDPAAALRADHDAWVTAGRAYQERAARGGIGTAEASDYAAYLAELRDRVARGCAALAASGGAIPDGVNCPRQAITSTGAPVEGTPAPSRDEARAALDAELNAALGEFDELLLREQDRARALRPREPGGSTQQAGQQGGAQGQGDGAGQQAGGTAGAEGGQAQGQAGSQGQGQQAGSGEGQSGWTYAGSSGQQSAAGSPDTAGVATGDGAQGSGTDAGAGPSSGQGGATSRPADLPDPSGDDVVARPLREAAERETDPELRARLWEEYRRYRRGIQ